MPVAQDTRPIRILYLINHLLCVFMIASRYILMNNIMFKITGTVLTGTTHYYYGESRYHAEHPWDNHCLEGSTAKMQKIDDEDRVTVRGHKAKEEGFNILQDMVFDAMHNVVLNIISQHLHYYLEKGMLPRSEVEKQDSRFVIILICNVYRRTTEDSKTFITVHIKKSYIFYRPQNNDGPL